VGDFLRKMAGSSNVVKPNCGDCDVDVNSIQEYSYIVNDDVWVAAGMPRSRTEDEAEEITKRYVDGEMTNAEMFEAFRSGGLLCIGCLEKRLGRSLTPADFDQAIPINADRERQSLRVKARMLITWPPA
jgi:hypothetical protein